MKRVIVILLCGTVFLGTAGLLAAIDGGVSDQDMPTATGICSNAVGCHTAQSTNVILSLQTVADDGEWNTPGEPGSLKVSVNIDVANSDADIAGIMLLDPDIGGNIKDNGWVVMADPNHNDTVYNYNRMLSVTGDTQFVWAVTSPESSGTYRMLARMHFDDDGAHYNLSDTVVISFVIGDSEQGNLIGPDPFSLLSSRPNPFSQSTTISYEQPLSGHAALKVYDLSGRLVRTLVVGDDMKGTRAVVWDGRDSAGQKTPEGLYFLRFQSGNVVSAAKTVFLQ
ncbi:MAG: FlgD immunoglobulin-like domain containing protein [bacterium]